MPYTVNNPPDYAKNLPKEAIQLCVAAFNATFDRTNDEEKARQACWGAVKTKFEQGGGGDWVRKAMESQVDLEEISTAGRAQALHNKLHGEYVDARWSKRLKAQISADHEVVVRQLLKLGGRHLPKGDALDMTLPEELRESTFRSLVGFSLEENVGLEQDLTQVTTQSSEIQVLRTGTFVHPLYGKFTITQGILDTMVRNFHESRPKPPTELVVDWEHMSTSDPPTKSPAAGWVKDVVTRDSKLYALVDWTDEAAQEIKNKAYRFISPEFNLNYKDKETGKNIGPTLLSVALTNRPFIEGMEPVVLSENLANMVFSEEVKEPMPTTIEGAEWTTQFINDLPDSSFAFVKPGGEKDENGKTVPRTNRYLPYKDAGGKVDLPHLRNALSRLPQTDLSPAEQAEARKVLETAAKEAQVGEPAKGAKESKEVQVEEKKLREALGIGEGFDILETIKNLKAKADSAADLQLKLTAAEAKAQTAETKLAEKTADEVIQGALKDQKLTPKLVPWAKDLQMRDPVAFAAFLQSAERVGPDLTIKGSEKDQKGGQKLTEDEEKVAEKMGVSKEAIMKFKEAQAKK